MEEMVLNILKNAHNEESVGSATNEDDTGNSNASVSNIMDAPSSLEGQNSNGKYQEDGNHDSDKDDGMAGDEDYSDLDLAWKILENARAIVEKSPNATMQSVKIFSALAAVSMEREDIDNSLDDYFKALAILDNLVDPDHRQIVTLHRNRRMCSVSELAFKIGDAIPYCAKVFSLCKSRVLNLKKAKGDKGGNASCSRGGSEKSALKDVMEFLTDILFEFEMKLENLEQEMSTPSPFTSEVLIASKASGDQSAAMSSQELHLPQLYLTAAATGSTGWQKDITVEPHLVRILEISDHVSSMEVIKLRKVLWSNQTESEGTLEHDNMML